MRDPYSLIKRPLVTEKSMSIGEMSKYVFEVDIHANKIEIAKAIEEIFKSDKIEVVKVNTLHVKGKKKTQSVKTVRGSRRTEGTTGDWKKAYVTLKPGQRLGIFEGA